MEKRHLIGYARVLTEEEELRPQLDALQRYGVSENRIITEKGFGAKLKHSKLYDILENDIGRDDRLVVWKLDRLGRTVKELVQIVGMIEGAGADFVSIADQIETGTPSGRSFFRFMTAMAEFESNLTLDRANADMIARKLADPDLRAGAKRSIADVPKRLEQLQVLYDGKQFELAPKFKQRGPDKGKRIGYRLKPGMGVKLAQVLKVLNDCTKKEKPIQNTLTISRWLEEGCPGLELRDEDKLLDTE